MVKLRERKTRRAANLSGFALMDMFIFLLSSRAAQCLFEFFCDIVAVQSTGFTPVMAWRITTIVGDSWLNCS